jgi:hypothetical protein
MESAARFSVYTGAVPMLLLMELKRTLLVLAVPTALLAGGATVIAATPTPSPSAPKAAEPAEAPEALEAPDAAGAADVGHADNPADANADHQFEGQE